MRPEGTGALRETAQLAGLWAVAVAHPVLDLLGRSPEFFVAHETRPGDLLWFVLVLGGAGPVVGGLAVRTAGWVGGARARRGAMAGLVGLLAASVALAALGAAWTPGPALGLAAAGGAAAAVGYARLAALRLFVSFLAPAAIVAPALFLATPAITGLLARADHAPVDAGPFSAAPPIVVIVFDQLPLGSLVDPDGRLDRRYPHLAAFADDAVWFRNASGVADFTRFALPPIVTGRYPDPAALPVTDDHPVNLFTLLGSHYRLRVQEPLTDLCPASLCSPDRPGVWRWTEAVLVDAALVYLWRVLPGDLAGRWLPPVTQSWNAFAAPAAFIDRWNDHRQADRRDTAAAFLASIDRAARPTLYFMHLPLPHEPWIHLPGGQRYTLDLRTSGLRDGTWTGARAAAVSYQRHLLQVGYVDTLLGAVVERLRETGLYDEAWIVVTADHGASLRAGLPFREPTEATFAAIAAVPLLIKRPGQSGAGTVVTDNVETIDILPTLAAALGARLPPEVDGANLFDPARAARPAKRMFRQSSARYVDGPGDLTGALGEAAARRFALFPDGDPTHPPRLGVYDELVGQPAARYATARPAAVEVVVDTADLLARVDPDGDLVPAYITGAVVPRRDAPPPPPLAIAINGVVAAVTETYPFPIAGRWGMWDALVDPRRLRRGANAIDVFTVRAGDGGAPVLARAYAARQVSGRFRIDADDLGRAAGVTASGFHTAEWTSSGAFRWTDGDARISAPIDPAAPPAQLTVDIMQVGPAKRLQLTANGCTLFDDVIARAWTGTFALDDDCRPPGAAALEIAFLSDVHVPSSADGRELGVALAAVTLDAAPPAP